MIAPETGASLDGHLAAGPPPALFVLDWLLPGRTACRPGIIRARSVSHGPTQPTVNRVTQIRILDARK